MEDIKQLEIDAALGLLGMDRYLHYSASENLLDAIHHGIINLGCAQKERRALQESLRAGRASLEGIGIKHMDTLDAEKLLRNHGVLIDPSDDRSPEAIVEALGIIAIQEPEPTEHASVA